MQLTPDSPAYEKALEFCKMAHGTQKRKYTNAPYWTHPHMVSLRLRNIGAPESVQIAGLLHDVVEDTPFPIETIREIFGAEVGQLVSEVTDVSKPTDGNREFRKNMDLQHIAKASFWGKTIKLADLIDNTSSIVKHDKDFATVYLKEKRKLLEVLTDGQFGLYQQASEVLAISEEVIALWRSNEDYRNEELERDCRSKDT